MSVLRPVSVLIVFLLFILRKYVDFVYASTTTVFKNDWIDRKFYEFSPFLTHNMHGYAVCSHLTCCTVTGVSVLHTEFVVAVNETDNCT